jgi:hypothetical protein
MRPAIRRTFRSDVRLRRASMRSVESDDADNRREEEPIHASAGILRLSTPGAIRAGTLPPACRSE